MTDEYTVITTRSEKGDYSSMAIFNGESFSNSGIYSLPDLLQRLFFHTRQRIEDTMRTEETVESFPQIKRMHVTAFLDLK